MNNKYNNNINIISKQTANKKPSAPHFEIKKLYVNVIVKHDKDGNIRPLSLTFNDGITYDIDKVKYICRAASLKAGGNGIRYTVKSQGKIFYLFDEENGKWFVENITK